MLSDSVRVTGRVSGEAWSMSTPAACLLLSRFAPAAARLLAAFRRLRDSLPPAEARMFAQFENENMRRAEVVNAVRLCTCSPSRAPGNLQSCGAEVCSASSPATSTARRCRVCGLIV